MKALRFLRALPLALLLSAPARADQGTIVGPVAGPKTMAEVMTTINGALLAIQSCNSGTSAPANGPGAAPKAFQCWADTSASPVIIYKTHDGASWVAFGQLNTSTHVWTPYRNGALIAAVATSSSAADLTTGTLPAARLPTPSASTLGGVQSKTCSASQWLNDLSTAGALSCAQPNFTDVAGTALLAQLPAFSGMTAAAAAADADTFPTNQGAGNLKQTLAAIKTWVKAWIVKADVGLGNVDNTSDITKWAASKTLTNTAFACNGTGNSCVVRIGTDVTGLGAGVATALAINTGAAGAPVLFNGALGTPMSGVATNLTGTAAGLTAGTVTTNANLTGEVTSVGNATTLANAPVIAKVLTGFASATGSVTSSDSILTAMQKLYGNDAIKAPLASPAFTGIPTAPTAAPSANSTQVATTAYVDAQVAGGVAGVGSLNSFVGALNWRVITTVFTSSGTWTPNSRAVYAKIRCWGGGAGGGGVASPSSTIGVGGGGGGSGSYSEATYTVSATPQTVTIGTGGAGGTAGGGTGTAGGDTSVGALCVGKGGAGGAGSPGSGGALGGLGGVAGTGNVVAGTGAPGQTVIALSGSQGLSGGGGSIVIGGGAPGVISGATTQAGLAATGRGSGGSGAASFNAGGTAAGGAGMAGYVSIDEYVIN